MKKECKIKDSDFQEKMQDTPPLLTIEEVYLQENLQKTHPLLKVKPFDVNTVTDLVIMTLNANKKKPKDHHLCQTGLVKLSVGNAIKKVTYLSTALQNMTVSPPRNNPQINEG